jgi:predicted negative regulator of RcsB-dependent stress response
MLDEFVKSVKQSKDSTSTTIIKQKLSSIKKEGKTINTADRTVDDVVAISEAKD